jgi:hypothetical protein
MKRSETMVGTLACLPASLATRSRGSAILGRHGGVRSPMLGALICWLLVGLALAAPVAAASPVLDRDVLEAELARHAQDESRDALQARLHWLADAHASLELAALPADDRKILSDRILARMTEVSLLLRSEGRDAARRVREPTSARGYRASLAGLFQESSGLMVLAVGGLVICFALGSLAGYRRGARQASYYGEADPRMRFAARSHTDPRTAASRVTLEQIRRRLGEGQPVLLQLGYEIETSKRTRFFGAVTKMQETLTGLAGQTFTVWEDPRHPNRFYECLECRDLSALDRLIGADGPLRQLAAEVEACRPPDGWVVRRAWWGMPHAKHEARWSSRGTDRSGE